MSAAREHLVDIDLAACIGRHDPGTTAAVFGRGVGLVIGGQRLRAVVTQLDDGIAWALSWSTADGLRPVASLHLHTYEASSVYAERSRQRAAGGCSARLSRLHAQVEQWFPTCDAAAQVTSWIARRSPSLLVRVIGMGAAALVGSFELVPAAPSPPTSAAASVDHGALWLASQQTLAPGEHLAVVARATGAGWQPDPASARGALTSAADSVYLAAAVGSGDNAAAALAAAKGTVDQLGASYEAVRELEQQHRAEWREYWQACLAAGPVPPDDVAWYRDRYEAGCALGGN